MNVSTNESSSDDDGDSIHNAPMYSPLSQVSEPSMLSEDDREDIDPCEPFSDVEVCSDESDVGQQDGNLVEGATHSPTPENISTQQPNISTEEFNQQQRASREESSQQQRTLDGKHNTEHGNVWHGYKIVGDNVDKNVTPRFQRYEKRSQSLHYFHAYASRDRINMACLSNEQPATTLPDANCLLPLTEDISSLKEELSVLLSR